MTHDEAIHILTEHNKWRRGEGVYGDIGGDMPVSPKELGEAIQYAIDQLKANQWQPIDTAPKNKNILIIGGKIKTQLDEEWDCNYPVIASGSKGHFLVAHGCYYDTWVYNPTHWMPLPQPPKGQDDDR